VHGAINYVDMIKQTRDTAEDEQYCTRSLAKNVIKINVVTPETYKKLVTYYKDILPYTPTKRGNCLQNCH